MPERLTPEEFNRPIENRQAEAMSIEFPHAEAGLELYTKEYPNESARAERLRAVFQEFLQQEIKNIKIFKSEQLGAELPYTSIRIGELAKKIYQKTVGVSGGLPAEAPDAAPAAQEFVFNSALSTDEGNEFNFVEEAMHEAVKHLPAALKALKEGKAPEEREVFTLGMPTNVLGRISPELADKIAKAPFEELGKVFAELVKSEMRAKAIKFQGVSLSSNIAIRTAENLVEQGLVTQDFATAEKDQLPYLQIEAEVPVSLSPSKIKGLQVPVGFFADALKERKLPEVKRIEAGKPQFGKDVNEVLAQRGIHEQMSDDQKKTKRGVILDILKKVGNTFKPKPETKITTLYGLKDLTTTSPSMIKAAKARKEEFGGTLGQNLLERTKPNERIFTAEMMHLSPRFRQTQLRRMRVLGMALENLEQGKNLSELAPEHIPIPEEVHLVFRELAGKEYKEVRKREDEQGLYLLEVEVAGEAEGEITEYAYMRKGRYAEGQISATEIHVTYYKDGEPVSGTSAARLIDGEWKIL